MRPLRWAQYGRPTAQSVAVVLRTWSRHAQLLFNNKMLSHAFPLQSYRPICVIVV